MSLSIFDGDGGARSPAAFAALAYEKPTSTIGEIDRAGRDLFADDVAHEDQIAALNEISDWRAAHSYPLDALHMTLRNRARSIDMTALTAQRLKRYELIIRKLQRRPTMQTSQMQDIGGCRAVVRNISQLKQLQDLYFQRPLQHYLSKSTDYVATPKEDGYRSVHLMYRFVGKATSLPWDKLRIELQLRTRLQHSWSTAVETVDAFTQQGLKFGQGSSDWRRFFLLMGSAQAIDEKSPTAPGTPTTHGELRDEVRRLEAQLSVVNLLRSYAHIAQQITGEKKQGGKNHWYVLSLLPETYEAGVTGFSFERFAEAKELASSIEKRYVGTKNQSVLVSANSLNELQKAYPNYFGDTIWFSTYLQNFLK